MVRSRSVSPFSCTPFKPFEKIREQPHVPGVDDAELSQLRLRFPVMRKIVVAVADRRPGDLHDRRADAVEHQSHCAGGIGFKCQTHQAVHVGNLGHVLRGAGGVLRFGLLHHRFGFALPSFRFLQAVFEFADAGEVLVETRAVGGAHAALEVADLVGYGIENGPARCRVPRSSLRPLWGCPE